MSKTPLPVNLDLVEYELLFTAMTKLVRFGSGILTRDELVVVSAIQIRAGFIIQESRRGRRAQRSVAS